MFGGTQSTTTTETKPEAAETAAAAAGEETGEDHTGLAALAVQTHHQRNVLDNTKQ